jgi:hypothetical protein
MVASSWAVKTGGVSVCGIPGSLFAGQLLHQVFAWRCNVFRGRIQRRPGHFTNGSRSGRHLLVYPVFEEENPKLKQIVAGLSLDKQMLQDV